jgi:hypothetical protein
MYFAEAGRTDSAWDNDTTEKTSLYTYTGAHYGKMRGAYENTLRSIEDQENSLLATLEETNTLSRPVSDEAQQKFKESRGTDENWHDVDLTNGQREFDKANYITFAGGGQTVSFTKSININTEFTFSADGGFSEESSFSDDDAQDITILVLSAHKKKTLDRTKSDEDGFSYSDDSSKSSTAEVTYELGDEDRLDKFVIEVKENTKFGTPRFVTHGGQSCCPHEPNTTPREKIALDDFPPMTISAKSPSDKCGGGTAASLNVWECHRVTYNEWAVFTVNLTVNYINCIDVQNSGVCSNDPNDNTFDYLLYLEGNQARGLGTYDPEIQGLVAVMDGVVIGKEAIAIGGLPNGRHSFSLQVKHDPAGYKLEYDGALVLYSACEKIGVPCTIDTTRTLSQLKGKLDGSISGDIANICRPTMSWSAAFKVSWDSEFSFDYGDDDDIP